MQLHLKNPKLPTMKAVYCFDASSNFICQNPNLRSRQEKMSSTYQILQSLLFSGQGVGVLFHAIVKAVEVNAKLQATILLPYQYHCIAPSTLARPDSTRLQHLLQVVPNLLNQWWGNPPKLLFKVSVICNFLLCVQWSGYSPILQDPMKTPCGTWSGANRWASASSGGQESNPLRSNSLNSFPCLCLTVNLEI